MKTLLWAESKTVVIVITFGVLDQEWKFLLFILYVFIVFEFSTHELLFFKLLYIYENVLLLLFSLVITEHLLIAYNILRFKGMGIGFLFTGSSIGEESLGSKNLILWRNNPFFFFWIFCSFSFSIGVELTYNIILLSGVRCSDICIDCKVTTTISLVSTTTHSYKIFFSNDENF